MELNVKLNELFNLLDDNKDIRRIEELKKQIGNEELKLIDDYRLNPSVENKKKIYKNPILQEYYLCESNIHYLILEINNKFKRGKLCQK